MFPLVVGSTRGTGSPGAAASMCRSTRTWTSTTAGSARRCANFTT